MKPGAPYVNVGGPMVRGRTINPNARSSRGLCELLGVVAVAVAGAVALTLFMRGGKMPTIDILNPFSLGRHMELRPGGSYPGLPRWPEPNVMTGKDLSMAFTTVKLVHPLTGNQITSRGYGTIPGPTIRVDPGDSIKMTITNHLTMPNPGCMGPMDDVCFLNTTNFHTHGLHVSGEAPGDSIFTAIKPGQTFTYRYTLGKDHMGGTHWYHPHYHHSVSNQAGGGAHGMIIVNDLPGSLPPLVANAREVPLVVSMLNIEELNRNPFPYSEETLLKFSENDQDVCLVNGAYQPRIPIQGGKWTRLRFVYAAIERVLSIPTLEGCDYQLLAKDGIYLNVAPRKISDMWLVPGGRADILIRCDANARREVKLESKGHTVVKGIGYNTEMTYRNVLMILDVLPNAGEREPDIQPFKTHRPCYLADLRSAPVAQSDKHHLTLHPTQAELTKEYFGRFGGNDWLKAFHITFDGRGQSWPHDAHMGNPHEKPPPAGSFPVGSVQEWTVAGLTVHPLHLHVVPYQIIDGIKGGSGTFFENGDWHDTYMSLKDTIVIRFNADTFTGDYVLHCHLLRHEDHGMMTYFTSVGREGTVWQGAEAAEPGCYRSSSPRPGYSPVRFSR